jgi:hypothetical protein
LSRVVVASPLAERLVEVVDEFTQANPMTIRQVQDALDYAKACIERVVLHDEPANKLN